MSRTEPVALASVTTVLSGSGSQQSAINSNDRSAEKALDPSDECQAA